MPSNKYLYKIVGVWPWKRWKSAVCQSLDQNEQGRNTKGLLPLRCRGMFSWCVEWGWESWNMLLESGLEVRREGVVTQMLIEKRFPGAVWCIWSPLHFVVSYASCNGLACPEFKMMIISLALLPWLKIHAKFWATYPQHGEYVASKIDKL